MGTISEKLTYLNVTKQKLKQAINNIGGEVTDETTFRNYVAELENAYDRLPKTEFEEGESVTLENTLKGKLDFDDGKVGFGQASQESTQGYNLINVAGARVDNPVNGVSVSKDGDSIILNGSRTDGSTTNSKNVIYATNNLNLESGDYRLTFVPESGSLNGGRLGVLFFNSNGDGIAYIEIFSGTTTTKSITLNSAVATLTVFYNGAFSATNYKFKVMLSQGTTERAYEQYTGGYASPSPNWEQQVKCVAGRNIWGGIGTFNNANLAKTNADGTIDINITNTAITSAVTSQAVSFGLTKVLKRGTYTFTAENLISNMFCQIIKVNSETSGEVFKSISTSIKSQTFTITEDMTYFVRVQAEEGTTFNGTIKPMICEGTTQHPYLPYNTIEEVVSGINYANYSLLFNNTDCYSISNDNISLLQNDSRATTLIDGTTWGISLKKGTYTLYTSGTGINPQIQIIGKVIGQIVRVNYSQLVTFNLSQDDIVAIKYLNTASFPINLGKVMIIEGTIANTPTYEPYITPKTYQFSLGDHKFYGIGTYRDYILRTTGKNLCNGVNQDYWINSAGTQAGKTTENSGLAIPIKANTTYTISTIASQERYRVGLVSSLPVDNTGVSVYSGQNKDNTSNSITITNTNYQYLIVNATDLTKVQIEEGSTASDYQPFGVGNWYKVGKIGNVVVDGTNKGVDGRWGTNVADEYRFLIDVNDNINAPSSSEKIGILCNIFKETTANQSYMNVQGICALASNHTLAIYSDEIKTKTIDEVNTWLHTNILEAYYPLVSPTYTPITGTLAEQLEEWWNGQSLNGTTIITSNGDLPMIIKVRGLKGE